MKPALVTLAAAAAVAFGLAAQPAVAKAHPRVPGLSCSALASSLGPGNVWRSFFHGERETLFNHRWPFTGAPCFRSKGDCQNWLYWAQTDYPLDQEIRWCRRGLG